MILINLLLSSIQKEWGFGSLQRSLLSSSVFLGFFVGSFISGYLTNKFGRRNPTIIGTLIICGFTSCTVHTQYFYQLLIIRIAVGVGIGIVVPGATSLVTECIPTKLRSFVLNILWVLYPLGIIYICYISMFFIENSENLDWRRICFVNSYTSIIMIFSSFALTESPRYLILKQQYDKAFLILNKIGSSKGIYLTKEEKEYIIHNNEIKLRNEEMDSSTLKNKSDFNIKGFFTKKYFTVSLLLAYLWFIASFISYGLLYILPKIFDNISKHDKMASLTHMISAMCILFPCPIFRGAISEIKFLGRKNAMIVGFVGSMLTGFICILPNANLSIFSGLLKFFINTSLGIVSVYTSEIYPTNLRSIALGFGNSLTRLGGILTPFICELIENIIPRAPFYMFVISSLTGAFACFLLPFETMGVSLDSIENSHENEKANKDNFQVRNI
jgi:putative MFS transporter